MKICSDNNLVKEMGIIDNKTKVEGFGLFVKVNKLALLSGRTVFKTKIIEIEYLIVLIRKIMYIREEK